MIQPKDYYVGPRDCTAAEKKLSEKKIENKAKKWARDHGWHVRKWAAPGNSGVPDDIFVKLDIPTGKARVVFIEFKRVGNVPTNLQCDEAEQLHKQGAEVVWCDTVRGVKLILEGIVE
jgi:hypothetical protein